MSNTNVTAIIPIKIDCNERLKNIQTSVAFLLKFFDFNIIIKEVDTDQKVFFAKNKRIKYIFEPSNSDYFHRTKILNDMLEMVDTKYTINYDCDILLPQENCNKSMSMLEQGYDLVYPYKKGVFLGTWSFKNEDIVSILQKDNTNDLFNIVTKFSLTGYHPGLKLFENMNLGKIFTTGGIQFFNTESYKKGFGENEEFIDWGPEDQERLYRFIMLGYRVGWIDEGLVCHLNHPPSKSSNLNTFYNKKNHELFDNITNNLCTKEKLFNYMNNLNYIKNRNFK